MQLQADKGDKSSAALGPKSFTHSPPTIFCRFDETGNAWRCECTFTIVGKDGMVLDSGTAPANLRRLPLQGMEMVGQPLTEVPVWVPLQREATPAL